MKSILKNAWLFWLGFGLSFFFNTQWYNWKYWVFGGVMVVLVELSKSNNK